MNVLFVREYPLVDGTFTLFVRLAVQMKKDGHQPYFLFFRKNIDPDLLNMITQTATILYYDELEELKINNDLPAINTIHAIVSGDSLYKTFSEIKTVFFPGAAFVLGVYHPRAFITQTLLGPSGDTKEYKRLFSQMPLQNLAFMNNSVKAEHESFFKIDFSQAPVVPLLLDIPNTLPQRKIINKNKIVSVGRLVSFKNYVAPVIRIIADLNKNGYAFEYHIYGTGPLYDEMQRLIEELKASSFVYLHGHLRYTEFNKVIEDALLFIGMGTSIIESCAHGIPSLLAIESIDCDETYGWFFDQQGYEVGEQIKNYKGASYKPLILAAYESNDEQYKLLCKKSWETSQRFSIETVMPLYYNFINNANPFFNFNVSGWRKFLLKLLRQPLKLPFFIKEKYRDK